MRDVNENENGTYECKPRVREGGGRFRRIRSITGETEQQDAWGRGDEGPQGKGNEQ